MRRVNATTNLLLASCALVGSLGCEAGPGASAPGAAEAAQSALATEPVQDRPARVETAPSIEGQSAERQRLDAQAEALALRTAIATQQKVVAQLRESRGRASQAARPVLDSEIAVREQRIAERQRELDQFEGKSR